MGYVFSTSFLRFHGTICDMVWRSTITVVTVTFSFLFDDDACFSAVEFFVYGYIGGRLANHCNV